MEGKMNDMITIPKEEYDRLIEAREDLDDIVAARRALDSNEESFPADMAHRMVRGESPLAVFRAYRNLSQSELSRTSGVNRVQIIEIEKGRKAGSIETMKKLAEALGVTIDDLV